MKIAGEYSQGKATPKHVEQLPEEAALAKPMVKRGVPKLAETILQRCPDWSLPIPLPKPSPR